MARPHRQRGSRYRLSPPSTKRFRRLQCESLEYRLVLNGDALVCVDYAFVDADSPGAPLTTLEVGQDYLLQAFIQDNRPGNPLGLFQAFFDVTYNSSLISVNGDISYGPQFDLAPQGDASTPGVIDKIGALSRGLANPGGGVYLLYAVPIHTSMAGTLEISAQPDEVDFVLFQDSFDPVSLGNIGFEGNTIEILDSDVAQVSIATTGGGNEAGAVPGIFTVTQSTITGTNTVIQYTIGGSATSGSDYTPLSGTATILAGQTSTTINVPVINDTLVEATETVSLTLSSATGDPSVQINESAKQATLNILDNDSAQVSIAGTTDGNEAGTVAGRFTVTQTAPSSTDTVVSFTLGGSADSGDDYSAIPLSATILAGQTTATIDVPVIDDMLVEGAETIVATLTDITEGDPQISLQGGSTQASINLVDNDTALVRVETTTNPGEGGPTGGVFTVTQTALSTTNTVIAYSLTGSATSGDDYTAPSGTVTILAGQTTATVTVPVINDAIVEANETAVITLDSISSGNPQVSIDNAQRQASMTIADNDSALVRIVKTSDGAEAGPVDGLLTVTQTAVSSTNTVVSYTVAGTATAGDDYTPLSGTVTILAGQTSATIDVSVIDDLEGETTETVIVTLGSVTSGDPQIQVDGSQNEATVEISDDETPQVSIAATNNGEEDGPIAGRFTVSQTRELPTDTVVSYTVTGTATSGNDFTPLSGTATILAGQTSTTIDVAILDDQLIEGMESVIVTLDEITSGDESLEFDSSNQQATIEILDDESGLVSIVATDDGAEDGPVNGLFTISQDGMAAVDTVISYTVSGTATAGNDYVALSGTATILAGQTSTTITLSVMNDALVEPDETVIVTLDEISEGSSLVAIDSSQSSATATIVDNDTAQVQFEATSDGSEDGPTNGIFFVELTAASSTDTVIHYTIGGSAAPGDDYAALSGTVTIAAGETAATIEVSVVDDNVVEATESVMLLLTSLDVGGAQVTINQAAASATVEIADNDTALLSVAKTSDGSEAGPTNVVFTVSLTAPSSTDTEVQYTIGGTATAGDDYTPPSGTVIIPAGSTSQAITIPVIDDVTLEDLETVTIVLDSITAGDPQITIDTANDNAAAEIADDESGLIGVVVTAAGSEAGPTPGLFTVSQNGITEVDTVISYTVSGTATAGDDYVPLSGTVTILAGQTSATIDVTVLDDLLIEGGQTVVVTLDTITSGDDRVAIDPAAAMATMTITDDDTGLVSIASDTNASETGPTSGSFIVSQSGIADVDTVISYTVTGTAASGSDFVALSGTVTILAGETSATITLETLDDSIVEATETVIVTLTGISSGSELVQVDTDNDTATVEIADNDSAQVSLVATTGGNETGSVAGVFTVTQSAISSTDTIISYTVGGTASSGSDFTALSGSVTILAGQTSATINVPVIDDAVVEGTENVELTLSGITGGDDDITVDGAQDDAALDILDNDNAVIAFLDATSSVFEVSGSHTVIVRLSIAAGGTLGQSVTVNVSSTGGTATGADFTLDTTTVTFAAGSQDGAQQSVTLSVVDDGVLEADETIVLGLAIDNGTGFPASIGATAAHTVTIVDDPSTGVISGFVWADTNGNGNRDANEFVIPGVTVRLSGVDGFGASVERTATTGDDGSYSFSELAGGTYDVIEQHPLAFNDGQESLGTVAGSPNGQVGNDRFTGISLGPTDQAVDYNFGEWGLNSQYVNVRLFLSTTTVHDFILRDIIQAAGSNGPTQTASTSALAAAPAAAEANSDADAPAQPTASPQFAATNSSQVIASAASGNSAQSTSTAPPPAEPAAIPAAADVSIANFLASTLADDSGDADSPMSALAFAAELSDDGDLTDEVVGDPLVAPLPNDASLESDSGQGDPAMLLEDPQATTPDGEAADEQLTDQALDEQDSWLEELVA